MTRIVASSTACPPKRAAGHKPSGESQSRPVTPAGFESRSDSATLRCSREDDVQLAGDAAGGLQLLLSDGEGWALLGCERFANDSKVLRKRRIVCCPRLWTTRALPPRRSANGNNRFVPAHHRTACAVPLQVGVKSSCYSQHNANVWRQCRHRESRASVSVRAGPRSRPLAEREATQSSRVTP